VDLNTELAKLHEEVRVPALLRRKFVPEDFWEAVLPRVEGSDDLEVEEIGRSALGRPLRQLRFGSGGTKVLVWSQMHGDEPTGTMALADLLRYLGERPEEERVRRWRESLSLSFVPILNPDGAARFQRRNAQGIDLNRDARAVFSPELRALFELHDRERPHFAIELHDEDTRTRVGKTDLMTGASLIAPTYDASDGDNEARLEAKRLCVVIKRAIEPLLGAHIARYGEHYLPTSIGTVLQARGTPTVLFETGWWPTDPELQFLRKVNTDYSARDILIIEGMFIHPHPDALGTGEDGAAYLETKRPASFTVRRGPEPDSPAVWEIERGVAKRVDEP
jgi:hypothetical protein